CMLGTCRPVRSPVRNWRCWCCPGTAETGRVVPRSPMTNLADVGRAHYPFLPVRTLLKEEYDVLAGLQAGSAPVAVMYSQADEVIPPELSAQVARADRVTHTVVLPTAGHNDAVMIGPVLADLVAELAEHIRTAG